MVLRTLLSGLGLLLSSALAVPVKYTVTDNRQVKATANGRTVTLLDFTSQTPPAYFAESRRDSLSSFMGVYGLWSKDFDGDGTPDALVRLSGGGNCCPDSFYFLTYQPGSGTRLTHAFDSWIDPDIEQFEGRWVARVRDEREATLTRYALKLGRVNVVDEQTIPELTAILNVRVKTFDPKRPSRTIDLNDDGQPETITCGEWERWATLVCGVKGRGGAVLLPDNTGCDRFGVLTSRTRGYRDLVCGLDTVVRFNGRVYEFPN